MDYRNIQNFYAGKSVLVTGDTGFKGAWLCQILTAFGAKITGYALAPTPEQRLWGMLSLPEKIQSVEGDVRNLEHMLHTFQQAKPEIVFHMAAQPLVREGYQDPVNTYSINVMGTVHMLECVRQTDSVHSVVNITTDKVYQNKEWVWGYREEERLDGYDPYSNSKSCSELVTGSYVRSFFKTNGPAVSTARSGNVIGGGDFAKDRIIPDCVRAVKNKQTVFLRNPHSIRPYQHVLEALGAYLQIAKAQYDDKQVAGSYNVGPKEEDCITTSCLTQLFCETWGDGAKWKSKEDNGPHESNFLRLDSSKIREVLGWIPRWNIQTSVEKTVEWYRTFCEKGNIEEITSRQIVNYFQMI